MIQKLILSGIHTNIDNNLEKYVNKKIGQLDKYLPKKVRQSMQVDVKLKDSKVKDKKNCTCEVLLSLPKETIDTTETTVNMYAAIDIVESKLKQRLKKYKELHGNPRAYRRVLSQLKRSYTPNT